MSELLSISDRQKLIHECRKQTLPVKHPYIVSKPTPPQANGADVAASPKIACMCPVDFGRSPFRLPRLKHLLASLPTSAKDRRHGGSEGTGFHRPATLPASGPVRRLVRVLRPFPSTWRFRDRFSALPFRAFRSASSRSLQLCFCRSRPPVKRPADIAPFAAFAVRQIPPEGFLRRVFQHCCGHRCQIVRFTFSLVLSAVSRWNFKFGSTLSTPESCASKVSRASEIVRQLSHDCGQVCG